MASMGPVEYVVIGFPGNRFKGEIVPAVAELVNNDVVRILDVAFIKKDAHGNATMFEYDSLDDVLEFGFADIEHRWAARVAQAIRNAGGRIIAGERVPAEIVEQALAGLGDRLTAVQDDR